MGGTKFPLYKKVVVTLILGAYVTLILLALVLFLYILIDSLITFNKTILLLTIIAILSIGLISLAGKWLDEWAKNGKS